MFIVILTFVVTLMHAYLFWRIASLPWFVNASARKRLWRAAVVVWLLFILGSVLGHGHQGLFASILERLAMDWLGVLFIAMTVLLAVDLLTGFGLWLRPYLVQVRVAGMLLAVLMILFAMVQGTRPPVVVRHEVVVPELPSELDGTTLVSLSDLHLGSQLGPDWLAERVLQVQALQPDIIVLLGDNFEGHGEFDPALLPVLSEFRAKFGVYAVTGNHEHFSDTITAIEFTEQVGVQWLRNRCLQIAPGLSLAGVDDLSMHWRNGNDGDMVTPVIEGCDEGAKVLFSHSPLQVKQAAAAGADLMLSGHTHGGQIWPFGYLVQRVYPYLVGRYEIDGMSLIIGRGAGLWGPRMRLWHPAEIVVITLRAELDNVNRR